MMLLAGWRRARPPRSRCPHRLFQHILGGALPCCRCCTVHNPCTRAAWSTGSRHVSFFTLPLTLPLVLQALLPGWILARSQVSLLVPLKREHKIRSCVPLLKACITTTAQSGVPGTSDKLLTASYNQYAAKANDLSKPLISWPVAIQAVPLKTCSTLPSHPTKLPQSVTNPTSHAMYKRLSVFISQTNSCPDSNKANQTCASQPRPVNGPPNLRGFIGLCKIRTKDILHC